jgi:hypothetical protein
VERTTKVQVDLLIWLFSYLPDRIFNNRKTKNDVFPALQLRLSNQSILDQPYFFPKKRNSKRLLQTQSKPPRWEITTDYSNED